MTDILTVNNLVTYFHTIDGLFKAVDGISFTIGQEETFGLVGESGCGKSTTGVSIMGMLEGSAKIMNGNILFNGIDICKASNRQTRNLWGKDMFMVFQDPMTSLNPIMKIGKQLEEVINRKYESKITNKELYLKKQEILKQVGIQDPERIIDQYPHQLSGGMKQRVRIGMGVFINPKLLILDEPTTALDATVQFKIIELIHNLKKKHKMSSLLITHDFGVAAKLCDYIGVMYAGKIVEKGRYTAMLNNPTHPYTKGLFNCIIKADKQPEYLTTLKGFTPSLSALPKGCSFQSRCNKVMPICKEEVPQFVSLGEDHQVACHQIV